jgi:ABC-type multidrug transport system permease subunit
MKNRILVFLVFITTILKGQSVDPETFPTVVGSVLGKNVYTVVGSVLGKNVYKHRWRG